MEVDSDVILNEVDELLSKLDKLPECLRLQALQKLSQKVSERSDPKSLVRGRGGPSESNEAITINPAEVGIQPTDEESRNVNTPTVVVSGRRKTKKVDYRQLAGHNEDKEKDKNVDVTAKYAQPPDISKAIGIKRGRGRPRRHRGPRLHHKSLPVPDSIPSPLPLQSSPTSTPPPPPSTPPPHQEYPQLVEEEVLNASVICETRLKEDAEADSLDLLESCLQESGIKVGDNTKETVETQVPNLKIEAGIDQVEEEQEEEKGLLEEEQTNNPQYVYAVNSLEELNIKQAKKKASEGLFKCGECCKTYSSLSVLKTHQIRHRPKSDLPFKCEKCSFTAASKIELLRHEYKHANKQNYVCEICGNKFSRDTTLREHIQHVHNKTQRLMCGKCDFSTYRRSTMRKHLLTHEGMPPEIACPVCGDTFKSKRNLKGHLYSHAGAKPHSCDECGKKFILKNRLVAHKLQVHSPRTHNCPHCTKMFPTIHHLKRHIRIHTGEKPYTCCFCSFSCNTQGNLIKHIRQVHDKFNFSYKDYLRETGREGDVVKVDEGTMKELSEEGKQLAQRLMPKLGEVTGCHLTLDKLKERVQKEKDSKVAALKEQQARKKRRILRKTSSVGVKQSTFYSASDGKITLYTLAEDGEGGGDEDLPINPLMDVQIPVEEGLGGLQDNQYLLTHTDDNGCVMIIPWDVSLTEEGDEDGAWEEQDIKVKEDQDESIPVPVVTITVPKPEDTIERSMDPLNSKVKLNTSMRSEKVKTKRQSVTDIVRMSNMIGGLNSLDIKRASDGAMPTNILQGKNFVKPLSESIQVIASNEPVDESVPSTSNFVHPEGYIVDNNGCVIQLDGDLQNLLLRQMNQSVSVTPDVTISRISDSVYSLMSPGNDGQDGEAFIIKTQDDDDDGGTTSSSGSCRSGGNNVMVDVHGPSDVGVMEVDLQLSEEEEEEEKDPQSSQVLIVNAEDLDGT